jgi:uncharacterized protein DUF2188
VRQAAANGDEHAPGDPGARVGSEWAGGVTVGVGGYPEGRTYGSEPMRGDIETYFEDGRWKNKVEGNDVPSSTHLTKEDARTNGREMAISAAVDHTVRDRDGSVGEHEVYPRGSDPRTLPR